MRTRLISVGERMPAWVAEGFAEYRKRLSRELPLELIEVPLGNRGKSRDPVRAMAGPVNNWPDNLANGACTAATSPF